MTQPRNHGTHGLLCPFGCGYDGFWSWRKLGTAIISDGEGGLVWVWSCPMCGWTLKSEPFAFPADMPETR